MKHNDSLSEMQKLGVKIGTQKEHFFPQADLSYADTFNSIKND